MARDSGASKLPVRTGRPRAIEQKLRIVDETRQEEPRSEIASPSHGPSADAGPRFDRDAIAPRARPSSVHIVWACKRYAASVRYQRVTLNDLSKAAGVSERRVRDAFCDCHGMSPTAYLRVAALREVRRTLLEGPLVRDAVTRAALDLGFWHLGRFAGHYRSLFGESPSETVARARARAGSR